MATLDVPQVGHCVLVQGDILHPRPGYDVDPAKRRYLLIGDLVIAPHLFDQDAVCPLVGRTHTDKSAFLGFPADSDNGAGWRSDKSRPPKPASFARTSLRIEGTSRGRCYRNEIGQALFLGQDVGDAPDLFRAVFDSQHKYPARRIGEHNDGFQRALRGG